MATSPQRPRVLIASDHAGVDLKAALQKLLPAYEWKDLGPFDKSRVDYPDYAKLLSEKLIAVQGTHEAADGILVCGSGLGVAIAANKVHGIRAATVENPSAARLAREHNDVNVLCLGARFVAPEYAAEIAEAWLKATFSTEGRHHARVDKITQMEKDCL